jgi:hypothetical protein
MKTLFAVLLAALFVSRAAAQVTVELDTDQDQFLPSEKLILAVKITNRSGQVLHLGEDPAWLTFNVESTDGFLVIKNGEVPVVGPFDLESSQMAIKRVDLQPYFQMTQQGHYRVTATLRIKQWSSKLESDPKTFDIINGAKLWAQDFGISTGTNGPPLARKYTLEQANYLKEQLRLYVQVSDPPESVIYKVTALGPMVSFSHTEAQVDRFSRLKVLWQTGAQTFSYSVVNPDGSVAEQQTYDNLTSRPRLVMNGDGDVVVLGGTRRMKPTEYPSVISPNELPPMTQPKPPPAAKK